MLIVQVANCQVAAMQAIRQAKPQSCTYATLKVLVSGTILHYFIYSQITSETILVKTIFFY